MDAKLQAIELVGGPKDGHQLRAPAGRTLILPVDPPDANRAHIYRRRSADHGKFDYLGCLPWPRRRT